MLYEELRSKGLELVSVALDTGGAEAARPFVERARPGYVTLVDQAHLLDELFGIVNVPSALWIDEEGTIVRPPEPAFPGRPPFLDREIPEDASPRLAARLEEAKRIRVESEKYVGALRDWVARGPESPYALGPEEVLERSRPRPVEEAMAAAHFELGQHLHRTGWSDAAVPHFREAHRLQPDNWTYKRQAWSLADPDQGPTDCYESDWLTDVQEIGAENYYPRLQM